MIRTPILRPPANAHAERFAQTVRRECLDWLMIGNERHLCRVPDPVSAAIASTALLHEYYRNRRVKPKLEYRNPSA